MNPSETRPDPVRAAKQAIRERVWALLDAQGVGRFPGAHGRIPNFAGAERAADRLGEVEAWRGARTIKANPDSPQRAVRLRALHEGKTVVMAVPRLRVESCFLLLDPSRMNATPAAAASIRGAEKHGLPIGPEEVPPVDLVVAGSVAVNRAGARLGKGGGYSDLEFALGLEFGFLRRDTPVVTTVHPLQIVDEEIPMRPHDLPVDWIVTPEEAIATRTSLPKPPGVLEEWLEPEKRAAIPVLSKRRGPVAGGDEAQVRARSSPLSSPGGPLPISPP
ncbi:MAG TPA: 5-formyltetrahydrofolate cyclo-ligase [Planctomycetota bacterium]|nr:5-formyltetrahydrofolate cyclo-ligase [Planctomycetota bacterium]